MPLPSLNLSRRPDRGFAPTPFLLVLILAVFQAACVFGAPAEQGELLSKEGKVDFAREKAEWSPAAVGQKLQSLDRVRTRELSRAMVRLVELGRLRIGESTTLEILPPRDTKSKGTLDLKAGAIYFFTRDRPREFEIQTPQALAASRGTEFQVAIEPSGRVVFTMFDGEAEVSNPLGSVILASGEQGVVDPGQPPRKTAVIQTSNIVQWWLYYPGVLDPAELALSPAEQTEIAGSLGAYRQGDLLQALESIPAGWTAQSESARIYHAAVLLSVGQVERAEPLLAAVSRQSVQANALRELIAAVHLRPFEKPAGADSATEMLADSYLQQSRYDLTGALDSARRATTKSPDFGFAWARVAELEFSFGHVSAASQALERALKLSPRNAQAWALQGFLAGAENRWGKAEQAFEQAIQLDPALGNGWLGRGLIRIRQGQKEEGRSDLQTAAAMEPNRSLLRSYLAKAFDHTRDDPNAARELALAKELDPADPTPWLYSALILRQQLQFNEAIRELEKSVELNDDRRVYRSRLLLDQDQAVRSASLATIYRNVGMNEVSVREAARAVTYDYANYSAHQFLAESFDALRDPTDFNLRYDTAWLNELLLANLLSPVGAGTLSRNVSQHEYSRLFASDRIGLSTDTAIRSDGQFIQLASQFGTFGGTSYSLDLDYRNYDGVRPNNDLSRIEWFSQIKQQLTPRDSLFVFAEYRDYESGDNFQYYDPAQARRNFRYSEEQKPNILAGYHHEWSPGVHTLLLGGLLQNDQRFSDAGVNSVILEKDNAGQVLNVFTLGLDRNTNDIGGVDIFTRSEFKIYSGELNQIFQGEHQALVFGGRFQAGQFETRNIMTNVQPAIWADFFVNPPADQKVTSDFSRASVYGYYTIEPVDNLWLTAGLAYDRIEIPVNRLNPPISDGEDTRTRLSPKGAVVWSPVPELAFRLMYSQSLNGVSYDESFRLEPTQLAGFVQSYRSIISESVVGSVAGAKNDVAGFAADFKFRTRTYVTLQAQFLKSDVEDEVGVFAYTMLFTNSVAPTTTPRRLEYKEPSLAITVNQLVSDEWSLGAQYRFTRSELHTVFPELAPVNPQSDRTEEAELQQATLFVLFNHRSGFFARVESQWYHQHNFDYSPPLATEDFWQHNFYVGYRLRRQRGEINLGVLNINDTDYRLNPLSLYSELPRERVFFARLKLNF